MLWSTIGSKGSMIIGFNERFNDRSMRLKGRGVQRGSKRFKDLQRFAARRGDSRPGRPVVEAERCCRNTTESRCCICATC